MVFEEITHPTTQEITQLTNILTNAFEPTPLFSGFLYPRRSTLTRLFLKIQLLYSLRAGRVFAIRDDSGNLIACSLWSLPNTPDFTPRTLLKLGLAGRMTWLSLCSPRAAVRTAELFRLLEHYAPETSCTTLEFLASSRPGAGAELVRHGIKVFAGQTLYVESIVSKNDHAYYRQFGFVPFAKADFHGTDYAFMLLSPQAEAHA